MFNNAQAGTDMADIKTFHLPDLGGTHRPLRDPDAPYEVG